MKKFSIFAAVMIAALSIGLSSCKDEKVVYYSCDPAIDAVIKQNLPYYKEMTRDEWKTLPDSLKDAALVAMKPELKEKFWEEKFNEMMGTHLFKLSEKRHIAKLYNYLAGIDDFFTDKYSNDSTRVLKVQEYYKEWALYGVDSLGWNIFDVILIAEDPEELTEDYVEQVMQKALGKGNSTLTHAGGSDGNPDCKCQYSIGCGLFTGYCDKNLKCDAVRSCGLKRDELCTGLCDEPKPNGNGNGNGSVNGLAMTRQQFIAMPQREFVLQMFKEKLER
jgi:hypothetical protein